MKGPSWYYKPANSVSSSGYFRRPASSTFLTELPQRPVSRATSATTNKGLVRRLGTPTEASQSKLRFPLLCHTYENKCWTWDGIYNWHQSAYLTDHYKCLWSRHGAVKTGVQK